MPKALRSRMAVDAVLVMAVLASIVLFCMASRSAMDDRSTSSAESDAKDAAATVAIAVVSSSPDDLDLYVNRVLKLSTGKFKAQFEEQKSAYTEAVATAGITATGRVVEAGIESSDDDSVVVLMAVSATVSNDKTPDGGEPRAYRMKVTMVKEEGRWLASELQLVG